MVNILIIGVILAIVIISFILFKNDEKKYDTCKCTDCTECKQSFKTINTYATKTTDMSSDEQQHTTIKKTDLVNRRATHKATYSEPVQRYYE